MNWITRIKKIGENIKRNIQKKFPTKQEQAESKWISCCSGPVLKSEIFNDEQLNTCPKCLKHFPFNPIERFNHFFGKNNYQIINTPSPPDDMLDFPGYKEKLARGRKLTGHHCAVVVAKGTIEGIDIVSFAIDSRFNGGSINSAAGEAIVSAYQKAIDDSAAVVAWCEGGGQAMQESAISLHFMVKTVLAANTFKKNSGMPLINV